MVRKICTAIAVIASLVVVSTAQAVHKAPNPVAAAQPFVNAFAADDIAKACSLVDNPKVCRASLNPKQEDVLTTLTYIGQSESNGYTVVGYTGVDKKRDVIYEIIVYVKRVGKAYVVSGVDPVILSDVPNPPVATPSKPKKPSPLAA